MHSFQSDGNGLWRERVQHGKVMSARAAPEQNQDRSLEV